MLLLFIFQSSDPAQIFADFEKVIYTSELFFCSIFFFFFLNLVSLFRSSSSKGLGGAGVGGERQREERESRRGLKEGTSIYVN